MKTITEAYEVPGPEAPETRALATLMGQSPEELAKPNGFLVGFAAGKAAAKLPDGARVVRVVVVAELLEGADG